AYRRSASLLLREEFSWRRFLAWLFLTWLFLAWAKLGCKGASRQRRDSSSRGLMFSPEMTTRRRKTMKGKPANTRSFPGRLTLEEWPARPLPARIDLIRRAPCERSQAEQPRQPQRDLGEIGHQH